MIKLGNVRHVGVPPVAIKAFRSIKDCGKVAVFLGKTSEAAAVPYYHPEYDDHLRRHHRHLVGVYLYDEDVTQSRDAALRLAADIAAAHQEHVKGSTAHG